MIDSWYRMLCFFFKQKPAYEMRISYWSSDVCSSDLLDWIEAGFGAWARHGVAIDPRDYDRKRRAEWTRPWDDDYEEVRAESPEYFTEEDDRERAHYLALTGKAAAKRDRSEEHTSELPSLMRTPYPVFSLKKKQD